MDVVEVGGPELSGVNEESSEGFSQGEARANDQEHSEGVALEPTENEEPNPYAPSASEENTFGDEEEEGDILDKKPLQAGYNQSHVKLNRSDSYDFSQQERELNRLRDDLDAEIRERNNLQAENQLLHGQVEFLKNRLISINTTSGMMSPGTDFSQNSLQLSGRVGMGSLRVPSPNRRVQEGTPCSVKRPRTSSYAKQQQQQRKQELKLNTPMDLVYEKKIEFLVTEKQALEDKIRELNEKLEQQKINHANEIKEYREKLTEQVRATKTSRAATRAAQRELAEKDKEKAQKAQELDDYPALLSASVLRKISPILNHYINAVRDKNGNPGINVLVEGDLILELLELARTGVATVSSATYGEKQVVSTYTESALDRLIRDMKKKITMRNYERLENEPLAESSMRLSSQIKPADKSSVEATARTPHTVGNKSNRVSSTANASNRSYCSQMGTSKSTRVNYDIDGHPVVSGVYNMPVSPTSPVSQARIKSAETTQKRKAALRAEQENVKRRMRIWGMSGKISTSNKSSEKKDSKDSNSMSSAPPPKRVSDPAPLAKANDTPAPPAKPAVEPAVEPVAEPAPVAPEQPAEPQPEPAPTEAAPEPEPEAAPAEEAAPAAEEAAPAGEPAPADA